MESDWSLRPHLFGFSLDKLRSILGSGDLDLFGRLTLALAERSEFQTLEDLQKSRQVLEDAICKGVPFEGLVAEGDPCVIVAITLAEHDQELTATGSDDWQMSAFWSLAIEFSDELEEESRRLIRYFCEGRPLFGKLIETDRSYYGYLSLPELTVLKTELEQLEEHIGDWEDEGTMEFLQDLIGWLDTIADSEQDLWFYAD